MKNEFARMTVFSGAAPVLRSVHAEARLEGLLLSVEVRQTYRNESDQNLEAVYTFSLAWGAVLMGLEVTLGERRMRGTQSVNASLEMPGTPVGNVLWSSALPARVADGETVHVFLRCTERPGQAPVLGLGEVRTSAPIALSESDVIARLVAAQQVAATTEAAAATALAERYQLVTDHTNLFLAFEREGDEKTAGMPALHQVPQMLAAGWGGMGTVAFSRAMITRADARYRVASLEQHALQMSIQECNLADGTRLDIPAFLRAEPQPFTNETPSIRSRLGALFGLSAGGAGPSEPHERIDGDIDGQAVWASLLLRTFAAEIEQGSSFRVALRRFATLRIAAEVFELVEQTAKLLGSMQNAWACYLLWLNGKAGAQLALRGETLRMLNERVDAIEASARQQARDGFESFEFKGWPVTVV